VAGICVFVAFVSEIRIRIGIWVCVGLLRYLGVRVRNHVFFVKANAQEIEGSLWFCFSECQDSLFVEGMVVLMLLCVIFYCSYSFLLPLRRF